MSLPLTRNRFNNLLSSIGKAALNSLYPDDFEYYACALELTDSKDSIVESLIFPVMPSEIRESSTSISNIKKTSGGVNSLFNPTFIPIDINLSGDFGRKFKIMINDRAVTFSGIVGNLLKGKSIQDYEAPQFSVQVKTGFGVSRYLQKIYDKSFGLDQYGQPFRCYFYNMALNTHYVVELKNLTWNQTEQKNMVWSYNIQMKAIAPAYSVKKNFKSSLSSILLFDNISKVTGALVDNYSGIFRERQNRYFN